MQHAAHRTLGLVLCLCFLLTACQPAQDSDTLSPTTTEPVVTQAPADLLSIVSEGKSEFVIIRAEEAQAKEIEAVTRLIGALSDCGVELAISTDFRRMPVYPHEIIIGQTERESDETYRADRTVLGESGFSAEMKDGKLYLCGGSAEATYAAVEWFIANVMEPAVQNGVLHTLSMPENFSYINAEPREFPAKLGEKSMQNYVIAYPNEAAPGVHEAADYLCQSLITLCGVRLPIVAQSDAAGAPMLLLTAAAGGGTAMHFSGENCVLSYDERIGAYRAADDFLAFFRETGGKLSTDGYVHPYADAIFYEDYGARGDGETDDLQAICAAHAAANASGAMVMARAGAVYYIGRGAQTAQICTDTDWRGAAFIIDDRDVENRNAHIFQIRSDKQAIPLSGIGALKLGDTTLGISLPGDCLVQLTNAGQIRYIRAGGNQNNGSAQTEVCLVHADGSIDPTTPLVWDYSHVTSAVAYPLDETTLTLRGGTITTIANTAPSEYTYYNRGIAVNRSNTVIEGITHLITGEGKTGAPYNGFIGVGLCANVTVRNCVFTGHKTYQTIGSAGTSVGMGSYEINGSSSVNLSFIGCTQTNDINDSTYWGVLGSNYCKNLLYADCILSRFDAHMGVANATIRNSTLGHGGLNAIGFGTLTVEDSTIYGSSFINLRSDYGSTWHGDVIIRRCTFIPRGGKSFPTASIFGGSNNGTHDFGYPCYLPTKITIDGFTVHDGAASSKYDGLSVFANINSNYQSEHYQAAYPIALPERIEVRGFTSTKQMPLRISENAVMFASVKLTSID